MEKLLLKCIRGEKVERPPIWIMRQAGRILPQYRALRSKLSGFKELVETPHLAAEVTLQPIDELDVDAAIIFSDILVIPEALGLPYEMIKGKGPYFPKTIESATDIQRLNPDEDHIQANLSYVYEALQLVRKDLDDSKALIGFCGAPWTILAYMIEGQGSKTFSKARKFLVQNEALAHDLLDKITLASIAYLKGQVNAGAEVIQLFDSWAGILSPELYNKFALPYVERILASIEVPRIFFAKGAFFAFEQMKDLPQEVLGVDWNTSPQFVRKLVGMNQVLQGNMDPANLYAKPNIIKDSCHQMIRDFGGKHVVNLGHGVYPDTPLEGVKAFVEAVKAFRY